MCIRDRIRSLKEFEIKTLTSWGHTTVRLAVGTFLLVVNNDHASILHGYGDTGFQRFWGHDLDLLGSRSVIGHVTNGLAMATFLLWLMMTIRLSFTVREI